MNECAINGPVASYEEINFNKHVDQLKDLDNLLKCSICYEYFNTCVITECSHNFCSLCIRRYIQYKTECPVCFCELYDSQLRANRIIDSFVDIFPQLKEHLIRQLRTLKTLKPNCIYVSPLKNEEHNTSSKKQISNNSTVKTPNSKKSTQHKLNDSVNGKQNLLDSNKVVIPKIFQSPAKKESPVPNHDFKYVSCPVCNVDIPERNINLHLDVCLKRAENDSLNKISKVHKRSHLPKLVFNLMSSKDLKAKVKEYGLSSHGDSETLRNRIQRYTALYNAECDKENPRPVCDIILQLEKEEKILYNQKLPKSIFFQVDDTNTKNELNEQYLKQNKEKFDKLIELTKERMQIKATSSTENSVVKQSSVQMLNNDLIQPSTSKSNNFNEDIKNYNFQEYEIDIDEMKVENILNQPTNCINNAVQSNNDNDIISPVLDKRKQSSRRLNFNKCDEQLDRKPIQITPIKIEPFDESTDSDKSPNFSTNFKNVIADIHTEKDSVLETSFDFGSPVIQKRTRRKRQSSEESNKKSLRKRKK